MTFSRTITVTQGSKGPSKPDNHGSFLRDLLLGSRAEGCVDLSSQPSTLACAHQVPALPDGLGLALALALALGAVGRCVHCFMGVVWVKSREEMPAAGLALGRASAFSQGPGLTCPETCTLSLVASEGEACPWAGLSPSCGAWPWPAWPWELLARFLQHVAGVAGAAV